ncbi:MAG: hypothetical protein EOO23_07000 [Comamonadaceae bacterium]|nr:MAG: hypothetical protein EOO23_07000 [Comamonadaceae bacterium]
MQSFSFGGDERERLEVQVHGYERVPVGEYHDDNWLRVSVSIQAGAFSGTFDCTFLAPELSEFRDSLQVLHETLTGVARFKTIEDQVSLELTGDGRGHIVLKGLALDVPGIGNRLQFRLDLDPGHLTLALRGLDEIVGAFPTRIGSFRGVS